MRCFMQCAAILLLAALSTNAQAQYYVAAVPQLSQVPQGQVQTQMAPAYVPQIQTQVQQPQMAQYYVAAMPSDAAIVPSPDPLPQVPPPSNVPVLTSEVPAAQVAQVPMQSAYAAPGCGVPNDAAYGYAPQLSTHTTMARSSMVVRVHVATRSAVEAAEVVRVNSRQQVQRP